MIIIDNDEETKDVNKQKDVTQDIKIEDLQKSIDLINEKILEITTDVENLENDIDDKTTSKAQENLQVLLSKIQELKTELATVVNTSQVIATNAQLGNIISTKEETDLLKSKNVISDEGAIKTFTAETLSTTTKITSPLAEVTKLVANIIDVVTFNISELTSTSINTDLIISANAILSELKTIQLTNSRLNAILITVSDSDPWHEPIAAPQNDELLKLSIPSYDGVTHIITQDGEFEISIINDTFVTFSQKDFYIFRIEFFRECTNIYFQNVGDTFKFKLINFGQPQTVTAESEIVDKTGLINNVNIIKGCISSNEILYGDDLRVQIEIVESLPENGTKNTIYLLKEFKDEEVYHTTWIYDIDTSSWERFTDKTDKFLIEYESITWHNKNYKVWLDGAEPTDTQLNWITK